MHMSGTSSIAQAWRPVVTRADRFHWLLGARVAVAFVGPVVVAHVTGRWQRDAPIVAIAALLVSLIGGALPPGRIRRTSAPLLVAALPVAALVDSAVPPHSATGIGLLVLAALLAGLAPLRSAGAGAVASAFALALIVLGHVPGTSHSVMLLLFGGAAAMALVVVTDVLRHPRLGLPALPAPAVPAIDPAERRRHAVRLAVTLGAVATLVALVGESTPFAAHSSWMLLGVWIALQPRTHLTRHMAVQRGVGTALGGLVTVLLAATMPHGLWIGWVFLALAFVAFGLRTVNYSWYCVLLTPIIVLGFADLTLDGQVLLARITWTAAGVLVAVVASHVLWSRTSRPVLAPASA